jgi:hypothetical protein
MFTSIINYIIIHSFYIGKAIGKRGEMESDSKVDIKKIMVSAFRRKIASSLNLDSLYVSLEMIIRNVRNKSLITSSRRLIGHTILTVQTGGRGLSQNPRACTWLIWALHPNPVS